MPISALPASGSTNWYQWATDIDTGVRVTPFPQPAVGEWIQMGAANQDSVSRPNGELHVAPTWLPGGTYDAVAFQVNSGGSAGATIKVVVYADSTTSPGRPGTLVLDTAAIDGTTSGVKQITGLSLVVPSGGGMLWAGTVSQGGATTVPNIWRVSRQSFPVTTTSPGGGSTLLFTNTVQAYIATNVTGAAPTSVTSANGDGNTRLAFRRSA